MFRERERLFFVSFSRVSLNKDPQLSTLMVAAKPMQPTS